MYYTTGTFQETSSAVATYTVTIPTSGTTINTASYWDNLYWQSLTVEREVVWIYTSKPWERWFDVFRTFKEPILRTSKEVSKLEGRITQHLSEVQRRRHKRKRFIQSLSLS